MPSTKDLDDHAQLNPTAMPPECDTTRINSGGRALGAAAAAAEAADV